MRVRTQIVGEIAFDGGNHREWATFRGSNGMLEFLNVESNVERCPSSIHLVGGYCGESRDYCAFSTIEPVTKTKMWSRLAIEAGWKSLSSPEAALTSFPKLTSLTLRSIRDRC